jgi:SNF2 family DNA or RNA helicase
VRIWLAKADSARPRHVVVDLSSTEEREFLFVVHRYVLPEGVQPWRERSPAGTKVRYRFSMKWLDRLVLTFPVAERAPAIDAKLAADSRARMHKLKNPPEFSARSFREHAKTGRHTDGTPFTLYPHQLVSIDNALHDPRHMINLGMGLGKTAIGWAVACALKPRRMLVITTYGGKAVWEDEMEEWTTISPERLTVVDGAADKRRKQIADVMDDDLSRGRIMVVNWDLLRLHPELSEIAFDLMIVDEFHRAKNPEASVTTSFLALRAKRELLMSGTPMINRTEELWTPLHRVCRKRESLKPTENNSTYPSAWLFEKALRIKFGGSHSVLGRNPDFMEQIKGDLDTHSTRFRRDQVSQDLPDIIPVRIKVKLTPEQRKLYNRLRDEFKMELEDGRVKTVTDARALITRLKQACWSPELYGGSPKSAKLDEVQSAVRDLVDAGEKAILFSQWSKATRILQRDLSQYGVAYVDGSVTGNKRRAEAKRFNTDPDCHLYIGTIGANREAITLRAATNVIFTDKDWSNQYNDQARDRSASGGLRGLGVEHVNVIEILAEDTVDLEIEELLQRKDSEFDTVVERDGGGKRSRGRRQHVTFDDLMSLIVA